MKRNVYHDLVLMSLLPLLVGFILAAIAYWRYRRASTPEARTDVFGKGANWVLFWSFLVYTGVSAKVRLQHSASASASAVVSTKHRVTTRCF